MKKIYLFFVMTSCAVTIYAQSPNSFKYQAVARDVSGTIIANSSVNMTIKILQGSSSGIAVCSESFTPTTNAFGLVNLEIGSVNPNAFKAINWANGPYFVEVTINGDIMGTSQLLSVPYALYAKTAELVTETDPLFKAHPANGITSSNISNWNVAFGWGNHASAGYLKNYTETDPLFKISIAKGITSTDTAKWNAKTNAVDLQEAFKNIRTLIYLDQ